jgi:hypothetical protein
MHRPPFTPRKTEQVKTDAQVPSKSWYPPARLHSVLSQINAVSECFRNVSFIHWGPFRVLQCVFLIVKLRNGAQKIIPSYHFLENYSFIPLLRKLFLHIPSREIIPSHPFSENYSFPTHLGKLVLPTPLRKTIPSHPFSKNDFYPPLLR